MPVMTAYQHIEEVEGEPARLSRLPRVRVAQIVMDAMAHGWTAEQMCGQHPHLTPAEVHSALAYYYDHQEALDEEIRREWGSADADASAAVRSPFFLRMKAEGVL